MPFAGRAGLGAPNNRLVKFSGSQSFRLYGLEGGSSGFASWLWISSNSFRRSVIVFGYRNSCPPSVSRTIYETTSRVPSLSSAGTTYQGEVSVLVSLRHFSNASLYFVQNFRFSMSAMLNFQFLSGSSIRTRKGLLCSSFERCWKNFQYACRYGTSGLPDRQSTGTARS